MIHDVEGQATKREGLARPKTDSSRSARSPDEAPGDPPFAPGMALDARRILNLQRRAGNESVTSLLAAGAPRRGEASRLPLAPPNLGRLPRRGIVVQRDTSASFATANGGFDVDFKLHNDALTGKAQDGH